MQNTLAYFQTVTFLLSLPEPQGDNLGFSLWEAGEFTRGKTHENGTLHPNCGHQEFLTLKLLHTQPSEIHQKFPFKCSHSFLAARGFCFEDADLGSDSEFICLSTFKGSCLPCDISFLVGPRKVMDFSLFSFDLIIRMGVMTSEFLTCWNWNWKSII